MLSIPFHTSNEFLWMTIRHSPLATHTIATANHTKQHSSIGGVFPLYCTSTGDDAGTASMNAAHPAAMDGAHGRLCIHKHAYTHTALLSMQIPIPANTFRLCFTELRHVKRRAVNSPRTTITYRAPVVICIDASRASRLDTRTPRRRDRRRAPYTNVALHGASMDRQGDASIAFVRMLPRISQVSTRLLRGLGLRAQTGFVEPDAVRFVCSSNTIQHEYRVQSCSL